LSFDEERFPELIRDLYRTVAELERMCGRPFTPDGHMVGSLAECFAAYYYGLGLNACSTRGHDASKAGQKIEIKATQGNKSVSLRSGPESLLVFRIFADGTFEEVYNGPGAPVWALVSGKTLGSNGAGLGLAGSPPPACARGPDQRTNRTRARVRLNWAR
jgi:hypothetical protein